jgi:hypothetical protein
MILLAILLAAQATLPPPATPAPAPPVGDDIVVVARAQKCGLRFADRDMSDAEFNHRAKDWAAGVPVRVIARQNADTKCLAKIAFRLADRGVKLIQFVAPGDLDAPPQPFGKPTP